MLCDRLGIIVLPSLLIYLLPRFDVSTLRGIDREGPLRHRRRRVSNTEVFTVVRRRRPA